MRPLTLFLLCLAATTLSGQSLFDLLYRDAPTAAVDLVLTVPLDSLRGETRGAQPATVFFTDTDGVERHFGLSVDIRGRFRRSRCATPPLKLDFGKGELKAAGLDKHDKYKLVNTCSDDSTGTNLLLKEYLAYRTYARLSPAAHFRAQLLRVTYRDAAARQPDRVAYAFLLEDTDEMAERAGGHELDASVGLAAERFDPEAEATHAMFQYLIGNADWSLPLHRNLKLVERPDGKLIPVGYDFDFSGWVGAPYASPSREVGQESIYQRIYLGYGQSDRTLRSVNQNFRQQRREVLALIDGFDLLPLSERRTLSRFVQRFYNDVAAMSNNTGILLYDQLRGATAALIPLGGRAGDYGTSSRR